MNKLISLLGKGQKELVNAELGYRTVVYTAPWAKRNIETPFVGEALARTLEPKPDVLYILGTKDAMWDVLLLHASVIAGEEVNPDHKLKDELERLRRVQQTGEADFTFLNQQFAQFTGIAVSCHVIPLGITPHESKAISDILDSIVCIGDIISLDITHGLRFQPMLIEKKLRAIAKQKGAKIQDIFYGALELPQPITAFRPILSLGEVLA